MTYALDTSVVIEYIDRAGEYHQEAENVFSSLIAGRIQAILPHPTLAETYYVSRRVYESLELENPKRRSEELIAWLSGLPSTTIPQKGANLAGEAGEAKLEYGLALTDCYVLATSNLYGCEALFKKREREMEGKISDLKEEYKISFLEDR